jgi:hypothetical protein
MSDNKGVGLLAIFLLGVAVILSGINTPPAVHAQLAGGGGFQYKKITTNVCTVVQPTSAQLNAFIVSSPGSAWTIQIFDNASACSGTAIFGATAVAVPAAATKLEFNIQAINGIAVLTAGTTPGELTVTYR